MYAKLAALAFSALVLFFPVLANARSSAVNAATFRFSVRALDHLLNREQKLIHNYLINVTKYYEKAM